MFEQLRCTHLRRGDVHRFGPQHIRRGTIRIATEKSGFGTLVEMPVHPDLIDAINATEIGDQVISGKRVGGRIVPMSKEAWAAKFKKYAIMAGVNEAKKNCHGVRKSRAEDAAYAGTTESQMMACFGWIDPKMAAHYIAQAKRALLGQSGMAKMFECDRSANRDPCPRPERTSNISE
jgi:integrase